jgi:hypothetical protein
MRVSVLSCEDWAFRLGICKRVNRSGMIAFGVWVGSSQHGMAWPRMRWEGTKERANEMFFSVGVRI